MPEYIIRLSDDEAQDLINSLSEYRILLHEELEDGERTDAEDLEDLSNCVDRLGELEDKVFNQIHIQKKLEENGL